MCWRGCWCGCHWCVDVDADAGVIDVLTGMLMRVSLMCWRGCWCRCHWCVEADADAGVIDVLTWMLMWVSTVQLWVKTNQKTFLYCIYIFFLQNCKQNMSIESVEGEKKGSLTTSLVNFSVWIFKFNLSFWNMAVTPVFQDLLKIPPPPAQFSLAQMCLVKTFRRSRERQKYFHS